MSLTRRERWVSIAAVSAVALLALERWVITPLWESYENDVARAEKAERELAGAEQQARREATLSAIWQKTLDAGAGLPISQAEGELLRSLETWRRDAGIRLRLTQPERDTLEWDPKTKAKLGLVRCRVSAEGDVEAVRDFLFYLQTDSAPVHVESVVIRTPDDKKNHLAVTMSVSWICQAEDGKDGKR